MVTLRPCDTLNGFTPAQILAGQYTDNLPHHTTITAIGDTPDSYGYEISCGSCTWTEQTYATDEGSDGAAYRQAIRYANDHTEDPA